MKIFSRGVVYFQTNQAAISLVCAGACCFCRWKRMVFAMCFNGICLVQVVWSLDILGNFSMNWNNLSNTVADQELSKLLASWVLPETICYVIFSSFLDHPLNHVQPFLEVKCKSYLPKNNPCMMFCQPFHCSIYIFFDSIPPLPSSGVVFREKNSTPWPYSWMSCQPSRLRLMHLGDASFIFRKKCWCFGKTSKKT